MAHLLLGQTLRVLADPFQTPPETAFAHTARGAIAIDAGRILAIGDPTELRAAYPDATTTDYGTGLLLPGLIDAHAHYPQTAIIASWGLRLIDWLNTYTFPEEARFADPTYAAAIAARYLDLLRAHGTTTVCSFATSHPGSVDALFAAAEQRRMRVIAGKSCMDRNAPDALRDTAQSAYDDSAALIARWHGHARLSYAITPRFSPTSSPEQLDALGSLWAAHPDCLMQTHLSEQTDEVAWAKSLFPEARDYLDTYERFGLLGPGALFGHAIWLEDREVARLRETDAALVHCPTSNTFIGSGLFATHDHASAGQRVGLATDTGGGSSFSMLRTMAAAYEVGQLRGTPLHPAQLLWLATVGSARALRMENRIGTLEPGTEADLVVLDLASTPAIAQRAAEADGIWSALFPTLMMGDDRAVQAVWIDGQEVKV